MRNCVAVDIIPLISVHPSVHEFALVRPLMGKQVRHGGIARGVSRQMFPPRR